MKLDAPLRAWLAGQVGQVVPVCQLVGGITSQMLHLRRADGSGDIVVRRWLCEPESAPALVRREAAGLDALAASGLPIPRLIAADPDGDASGLPTTVTTFVDGSVELAPPNLRVWVRQLAAMLVRIHTVPIPDLAPCDTWIGHDLVWLGDQGLIAAATDLAARPTHPEDIVVSHGDYQHFNVLWHQGEVAHVIDWPNAGLANRGRDVGHCRLNLAVLFSADTAMQFLDDYEELAGLRVDPAADIERLLCFDDGWVGFIPIQVAGRAVIDGPGMAGRVRETVIRTLDRAARSSD